MAHEHEVHVYNVMTSMHYDLQYGNLDLVDDGFTIAGILGSLARPPGRRSQKSGIERARCKALAERTQTRRGNAKQSRPRKPTFSQMASRYDSTRPRHFVRPSCNRRLA
jgi:hypothetical protein